MHPESYLYIYRAEQAARARAHMRHEDADPLRYRSTPNLLRMLRARHSDQPGTSHRQRRPRRARFVRVDRRLGWRRG